MKIYLYILAMALTTYLIRVLPLTVFRKPIQSRFIRSFLHYVPYACLTAMTFPAILYDTTYIISGIAALIVAIVLAFRGKSLLTVSLASCAAVFLTERIVELFLFSELLFSLRRDIIGEKKPKEDFPCPFKK